MNYNFDENEMPYNILERFGLTQAMIDDLPTDVLQNIHNGRKSPVLPVHITADDGEEVRGIKRTVLQNHKNPVASMKFAYIIAATVNIQTINVFVKPNLASAEG